MAQQRTFCPLVDGGGLFGFPPNGLEKINHVPGCHVSATAEGCSGLRPGCLAVFNHFAFPIIQFVAIPVNIYAARAAIDNCTPVAAVGFMTIAAFAVPLDNLVAGKSERSIHGVIHHPAIVGKRPFGCFDRHILRKIDLQGPAGHIQFVGGVVAALGGAVIPAIPVPVIIPGIVHVGGTGSWSLKQLPV